MNDAPDINFEVPRLSPKKTSYALGHPRGSATPPMCRGRTIKTAVRLYSPGMEKAVTAASSPSTEAKVLAQRALRLGEALAARNAAANRMYLHRAGCASLQAKEVIDAAYTNILCEPKGALGGYKVTGWRYVEDRAWHVKAEQEKCHWDAQDLRGAGWSTPPRDSIKTRERGYPDPCAQWEAGLPDTVDRFP